MTEAYFPNQAPFVLNAEEEFRREVVGLPEDQRYRLYEVISRFNERLTATRFSVRDGVVSVQQASREILFPSPIPMVKLSHIIFGYEEWLHRKYTLPGFVAVEPDDLVIDCGAYVGGFSLGAAQIARHVHAFEPAPGNFRCLNQNFAASHNVTLNKCGLFSHTCRIAFNLSPNSVEHSILTPDDSNIVETVEIEASALEDYAKEKSMDCIDFLKIEAEGVELEVFDGLGSVRPRKIAIDVSPERDGESPAPQFIERLSDLGYEIKQRANVLFARLPKATPRRRRFWQ